MKVLLAFTLCSFLFSAQAQRIDFNKELDSLACAENLDYLRKHHSYNKTIPKEFELSILTALSFFPELDSTEIEFKYAKISTTLNARPTIASVLFKGRKKRKYIVRINSYQEDSIIKLKDVPFDARVGIFGHEFCHFLDYMSRSFFGVTARLLSYTNKKTKERFEKEIDSLTIAKGLGWQLHHWSSYAINDSYAAEEYKLFKEEIYLEPYEIVKIMEQVQDREP